jgi:hypothetical protein
MKISLVHIIAIASLFAISSADCLGEIMALSDMQDIGFMLLNTGKGINDLGQMDACNANEKTKYAIFYFEMLPFVQGFCIPAK